MGFNGKQKHFLCTQINKIIKTDDPKWVSVENRKIFFASKKQKLNK